MFPSATAEIDMFPSVTAANNDMRDLFKHWGERYFQASGPVNYSAVAAGFATVLNMHQGNVINPW